MGPVQRFGGDECGAVGPPGTDTICILALKKAKCLFEEDLQIAEEKREVKGQGDRENYTQLNAESQRIGRSDKKAF